MQKTINYLKVVVIGYGSVGKRHVQNLLKIPNTKIIIYTKQKIRPPQRPRSRGTRCRCRSQ